MNFATCREGDEGKGKEMMMMREGPCVLARFGAVYCDVTRAVPTALFSTSHTLSLFSSTCAEAAKYLLRGVCSADRAGGTCLTGTMNSNQPTLSRLRTSSAGQLAQMKRRRGRGGEGVACRDDERGAWRARACARAVPGDDRLGSGRGHGRSPLLGGSILYGRPSGGWPDRRQTTCQVRCQPWCPVPRLARPCGTSNHACMLNDWKKTRPVPRGRRTPNEPYSTASARDVPVMFIAKIVQR
ncbi:hypothetical protein EDB87DRAFT_448708 [Lactarius vividus]|nr:hypothetical protein EDB87DRAFT_448708 [Lactarius vividus]